MSMSLRAKRSNPAHETPHSLRGLIPTSETPQPVRHDKNKGFTLIELSIVLVIIGLIVGGILVGQNLITAAGIRGQVTQIEKYNSAANAFREKCGYLPVDIPPVPASQFGLVTRTGIVGQGDGDGVLTARGVAAGFGMN